MKDFQDNLELLVRSMLGVIHKDDMEKVDKLATDLYNNMSESLNEAEVNNVEALAALYSAILEIHTIIYDGLGDGEDEEE